MRRRRGVQRDVRRAEGADLRLLLARRVPRDVGADAAQARAARLKPTRLERHLRSRLRQRHVRRTHDHLERLPVRVTRERVRLGVVPRLSRVPARVDQTRAAAPAQVARKHRALDDVVVDVLVPEVLLGAARDVAVPLRHRIWRVLQDGEHPRDRLVQNSVRRPARARVLRVHEADVHAVDVPGFVLADEREAREGALEQRVRVHAERNVRVHVHGVVSERHEALQQVEPSPPQPERVRALLALRQAVRRQARVPEQETRPRALHAPRRGFATRRFRAPRSAHALARLLGVGDEQVVLYAHGAQVRDRVRRQVAPARVGHQHDDLLFKRAAFGGVAHRGVVLRHVRRVPIPERADPPQAAPRAAHRLGDLGERDEGPGGRVRRRRSFR